MTSILVTGSSGVLGRSVYNKLIEDQSLKVIGLVFSRNTDPQKIKCDLTNLEELSSGLNLFKPAIIIHAAAERRPDIVASNELAAQNINVSSVKYLSEWCAKNNAILIFISTDYVFDGKNPPYTEETKPLNPLNLYGKMKVEAENIVMLNKRNVILRLPILYGSVEYIDETAVTILFNKVKDNSTPAAMSNYELRYPTHCDDVASTLYNMVNYLINTDAESSELHGVFHYQSQQQLTKLQMSQIMAGLFNLPSDHLFEADVPSGKEATQRPHNSQMSCDKLIRLKLYHNPRSFEMGIKQTLQKFM